LNIRAGEKAGAGEATSALDSPGPIQGSTVVHCKLVLRPLAPLTIIFALTACSATRPWTNRPLLANQKVRYDGAAQIFDRERLPEVLVVANFSGGGSRSAAFAYAVVSELEKLPFAWGGRQTSLAREVDVVTGVSGGAVAAAHMALHGLSGHLELFPREFLEIDFQRGLFFSLVAQLGRASSPWWGRGNLLANGLDDKLYKGATFGDLARLEGRPYLIVASTDLSSGHEFDFTADQLALLCSSIDEVPLAFAVAASSAVPALFSPLTLESHQAGCPRPLGLPPAGADLPAGRRFLHLVDGGVADDLGKHRIASFVAKAGGIGPLFERLGAAASGRGRVPRRIVFLSVKSERRAGLEIDHDGKVPGAVEVINAMLYSGLGRQTHEASLVFRRQVEQWRREIAVDPALGGADVDIFDIEIKLDGDYEPELQRRVLAIPTAFKISEEDFELLRRAAAHSLAASAELQRFLHSTREPPPQRAAR
jgi:NTE family protein